MLKNTLPFFFVCLPLLAILSTSCKSAPPEAPASVPKNYFGNGEGCILLYNLKTNQFAQEIGGDLCKVQYSASSTFKVPLAVMAFDSGALKDENVVLKWNGKKDIRVESNRDHNAKTWMRDSIVWFSQRLTPKMGFAKTQKYLNDFNYGNKDLSGGLTDAWLHSPNSVKPALKISAYEQIEFMKKLWQDQLPASARAMKLTREITYLETSPAGFALNGKTGSNFFDPDKKFRLGWFISHVQKGENEYLAVVNYKDLQPNEEKVYGGMKAKEITKSFLTDQQLW